MSVYGNCDSSTLVFTIGARGGSGRGAVNQYNLLCDLLSYLYKTKQASELKKPGPVHNFLAKDIMSWNNAFADDAFANGKVPGWELYLAERRAEGVLETMKMFSISR